MTTKLYLCALVGISGLTACQHRATRSFMPPHAETVARALPVTGAAPTAEALPSAEPTATHRNIMEPLGDESEFTVALPSPTGASPVLLASAADRLVDRARGTRREAQALRLKVALEKATASGNLSAAPRKLNVAERAVTKLVTKKLNKKNRQSRAGTGHPAHR